MASIALGPRFSNTSQPKELLSTDDAVQQGWINNINGVNKFCTCIPLTRLFAKALQGQITDQECVHVVVTAEKAVMVEEHNEGRDVATELPEIRCVLSSPYNLGLPLTSL